MTDDSPKIYRCPLCGGFSATRSKDGGFLCEESRGGCARDFAQPNFLVTFDGDRHPKLERVHPNILLALDQKVDSGQSFRDAWAAMADDGIGLEDEFFADVEQMVSASRSVRQPIHIGSGRRIERDDEYEAYVIARTKDEGEVRVPVIGWPLEVKRRIDVEGEPAALVHDAAGEFGGTFPEILKRLRNNGQILSPRDGEMVLAHIVRKAQNHTRAWATFGIYAEEGKLVLPSEYLPRTVFQRQLMEVLRPALNVQPTEEDWTAYHRYSTYYESREWMPAYALAATTCLAPVLRAHHIAVPAVFLLSMASGVGKSWMARAVTERLWGTQAMSANVLNSDFRFGGMLDCGSVPCAYEEAQRFRWTEYGDLIKQALESETITSRGTRDLGVVVYKSRSGVLFTGNTVPPVPRSVLNRMIMVKFNEARTQLPSDEKDAFDRLHESLPRIGPALAQTALQMVSSDEQTLVNLIRETIRGELERRVSNWQDSRRPAIWAGLYFGLQVWERASGGILRAPTYEAFAQDVIEPCEEAARLTTLDRLDTFRNWIFQYRARNATTARILDAGGRTQSYDTIRGQGELFEDDSRGSDNGWLVTSAFLDLYNRDQREPEGKVTNLIDLAQLVSGRHGIPMGDLMTGRGAKMHKFGRRSVRAVFVPDSAPEDAPQARLDAHPGPAAPPPPMPEGPSAPPPPPVPTGTGDAARAVVEWLRAEASGHPGGVPRGRLFDLGRARNVAYDDVKQAIGLLLRQGTIMEVGDGAYMA